jgi:5'-methylthioadenosine phosphorylase
VDVGVLGGSGLVSLLEQTDQLEVDTPFGSPSAPVAIGKVVGKMVAFLPRHGPGHELPPHRINARANVWALHALGARAVLGPCAVGSLRPDRRPGELVVPDQLVDRTYGRLDTYFDGLALYHVPFADPYCPRLRRAVLEAAASTELVCHNGGTVVVIQGPRFSTRAESAWFRSQGWDVVNMTQYPEAVLARELGICYAGIAQVTDNDVGTPDGEVGPVTQDSAFAVLSAMVGPLRRLLVEVLSTVSTSSECECVDPNRVAVITP